MRSIVFIMCLLLSNQTAVAELVKTKLPNGLNVTAEYDPAEKGKPTLLVMHPFLQTHNFSVIANLTDSLVSEGYGVLRPTLSLGIDGRKQSLPCEAVHAYSLQDKIDEIGFWRDWLEQKSIGPVIGFGHSSGASYVAMYEHQQKSAAFKSLTLLTPIHYGFPGGTGIDPAQRDMALEAEQDGKPDELIQYKLSFCEKFTAPRSRYLEYTHWDETAVTEMLEEISIHTHVVYGTADPSLNDSWKERLEKAGKHLIYVPEGNHFFSGPAEFDMHDVILDVLSE